MVTKYVEINGLEWCRVHAGLVDELRSNADHKCDNADEGNDGCDIVPLFIEQGNDIMKSTHKQCDIDHDDPNTFGSAGECQICSAFQISESGTRYIDERSKRLSEPTCVTCDGTGFDPEAQPPIKLLDGRRLGATCPDCEGDGVDRRSKFDVYLTTQQCEALLAQPDGKNPLTRRAIRGAKRAIRKAMAHPISYDDQRRYEHGAS